MIHPSGEKKIETSCQCGRTSIASGDLVRFEASYLWYITICGMTSCYRVPSISCDLKESTQTEGGKSHPKDCSTDVQGAHWISDA
jgi:hypothetical protein